MADPDAYRKQVGAAASELSKHTISRRFDEKLGSKDWARTEAEVKQVAEAVGADFLAALLFTSNIPPPADYVDAQVLANDISGVHVEPLYGIRQRALLAMARLALL